MTSRRRNWLLGFLGLASIGISAACSLQHGKIDPDWGIPLTVRFTFPHLQSLELPRTVDRLDWLRSSRLKRLEVSGCAVEERLTDLPGTLETLLARNIRVTQADIRPSLTELDIRYSDLDSIRDLPESLETLAIGGGRLIKHVELPSRLTALVLEEFDSTVIELFPSALTSLTIIGSRASIWRGDIPSSLEHLTIRAPRLEHIPELPANVISLVLITNPRVKFDLPPYLTTFESAGIGIGQVDDLLSLKTLRASGSELPGRLPDSLQHLAFIFQGEASPLELTLPDLPNLQTLVLVNYPGTVTGMPSRLIELDISRSPEISLVNLPPTLRKLVVARRQLIDLSKLPQSLEFLDISYVKKIDGAGVVLPKLTTLIYQGNSGTLPALGENLAVLDVSNSPDLKSLPQEIPPTLKELHIRSTGIAALPIERLTGIEILDVCDSQVKAIKALPPRLVGLRAHENQLDRQIEFPDSLRHLAIRTRRDCAADDGLWSRDMELRRKEGGGS